MNNAVMVSIQPKWCELIANGKKTYEIRKTKPKLDVPFKCYIYCTLAKNYKICADYIYTSDDLLWLQNGKVTRGDGFNFWAACDTDYKCLNGRVIGEFVCDKIYTVANYGGSFRVPNEDIALTNRVARESCLDFVDLKAYAGNRDKVYAWHISDLKIYDESKEIPEFTKHKKCTWCKDMDCGVSACMYDEDCIVPYALNKPPQSYCFVEEL